ncbi:MAG: metallophosphoesterase family protein [Thermoanaerobaculia bacterium]
MTRPGAVVLALLAGAAALAATSAAPAVDAPQAAWAFAVSGDSRDCGNVVMPKIAWSIENGPDTPAADFYWHLGDFRRGYAPDCDFVKRSVPGWDCRARPVDELPPGTVARYLDGAWDDFVDRQLGAFHKTPVFLAIGNHELYVPTREDFRRRFRPWLASNELHAQRNADAAKGFFGTEGNSWYHFVRKGVDVITLDNADGFFPPAEISWLTRVLAADAADDSIRTIVIGMHATLPYSTARGHAMDASCAGLCSGQQVYDLLFRAQNLAGPPEKRKKVYVFSSHSHEFAENVYDTPEHRGQVLPGWIVGTAGAQQFHETIRYGYVRAEILPDGTLRAVFREVGPDSPPAPGGPEAASLTDFCFRLNRSKAGSDTFKGDCACGAAR